MTAMRVAPFVIAGLGLAVAAPAETILCTSISSLPYVINTSGIYCLNSDFNQSLASGAAITVNANNVVIDMNAHKIGNLSAGPATSATGIYGFQRQNVTIRNGTLRGFRSAIHLADDPPYTVSQGHLIEGVRADQNTLRGIWLDGRGGIVHNNQVVATGGITVSDGDPYGNIAHGILVNGPGNRILNNDVISMIQTNLTSGVYSIFLGSAPASLVVGNRVTDSYNAFCCAVSNGCTGKLRDNLSSGVINPFFAFGSCSGTDAGNNN